jgi:phage terminase large subunit
MPTASLTSAEIRSSNNHHFRPRGAAQAIFTARDPEVLLSGPAGTGKSRACMEKLHMMALKNPGMRALICRKTATSLSSTALVTWQRFVIPEAKKAGEVWFYGGSAQEAPQYKYKNGSVVAIGGMDNPDKIMSSEYDVVYVQEATELTETDWETITTRLRYWSISFQQIIADCNPSYPQHWLKQRCDRGVCRLLPSRHEDNPTLFDDLGGLTVRGADYISKLDRLTGVRLQRLRYGKWVAAEGVIYDQFMNQYHVVDRIPEGDWELDHAGVPVSWPRFWGVDFGFVNPFVLQCWAEDPDGRLWLYREIYHTHITVDVHARTILAIVAPNGKWREPKPRSVVCDHDAEGRAVLERELGITCDPAHKSVLEGIEAVQVRIKTQDEEGAPIAGYPRIFFVNNCTVKIDQGLADVGRPVSTIEEIPGYVWADKTKEQPVKEDDHGCDAMRYVVAERDFGVRALYRSFTAGVAR